jgi:hypothetical protein
MYVTNNNAPLTVRYGSTGANTLYLLEISFNYYWEELLTCAQE